MSNKYYLDWSEVVYNWNEKEWDWKDVFLLINETIGEIISGGGRLDDLDPLYPWESIDKKLRNKKIPQEKIDKLLEVIVSVKGESKTFKKNISNNTKITIDDIQKTLNKYNNGHIKVHAEIKNQI